MGEKKTSDAQKRAAAKYDAANTVRFGIKLNKKTDVDIIDKFKDEQGKNPKEGIQGYLKRLVRKDIRTRD